MDITNGYAFLIKTNKYAGNFEREMCAHVTGQVGECEVGEEYVEEWIIDQFSSTMTTCPDDSGCYRPCGLGDDANDVVLYFHQQPSQDLINIIKSRAYGFKSKNKDISMYPVDNDFEIKGFQLLKVWVETENIEI